MTLQLLAEHQMPSVSPLLCELTLSLKKKKRQDGRREQIRARK
jgi:hypothetical protein